MAYSLVGILAVFVHLIINLDVFLGLKGQKTFRGQKHYALFLLCVIAYHVTDGFWGFLYDAKLITGTYADTVVYFLMMAASILSWGIFVYHYLDEKSRMAKPILYTGFVIFAVQIVMIVINFFFPFVFSFGQDGTYNALPARYAMLGAQVFVYVLLAIYTFVGSSRSSGSDRRRFIAVGLFSLFMAIAITFQTLYPLLPLYSIGYLFGICALHTFVIRDELVSRQHDLEEARVRISTDPLTGVYSKHAYVDVEEKIENEISSGNIKEFAAVIFDVNDLKVTNDTQGHGTGDKLLCEAAALIGECYPNIPVYRVGGDEFVVFLLGDHYQHRDEYLSSFNARLDRNLKEGAVLVAAGMSLFLPDRDTTVMQVYTRADQQMYTRKQRIKLAQETK